MELFHKLPHIDFMGQRKITAFASSIVFIVSLVFLGLQGLNFGLDFTGGTQLELRYAQPAAPEQIREQLRVAGFDDVRVAHFGSAQDILVRLANRQGITQQQLGEELFEVLNSTNAELSLRRIEFVGAEVGEHLAEQGALAVLVAVLATMLYIAMRFEYRFAISAAVALLHDPVLILGVFSAFQIEFDLAALAAMLAVIGYSLNDTIVVYDRIRENFRKLRKGSAYDMVNLSINQTLSRTIMTSVLTLLVVLALFIFGGETLHGFSTALMVGIVIGTYSSIFVAGGLALSMGLSKANLMPTPKVTDNLP
jgi:preprotein translocase subunit SecF